MASSSSSSLSPEYLQLPVFSAINMGGRGWRGGVPPSLSLRRRGGDRERRKEEGEELYLGLFSPSLSPFPRPSFAYGRRFYFALSIAIVRWPPPPPEEKEEEEKCDDGERLE